jgi:hypothetical protein
MTRRWHVYIPGKGFFSTTGKFANGWEARRQLERNLKMKIPKGCRVWTLRKRTSKERQRLIDERVRVYNIITKYDADVDIMRIPRYLSGIRKRLSDRGILGSTEKELYKALLDHKLIGPGSDRLRYDADKYY